MLAPGGSQLKEWRLNGEQWEYIDESGTALIVIEYDQSGSYLQAVKMIGATEATSVGLDWLRQLAEDYVNGIKTTHA